MGKLLYYDAKLYDHTPMDANLFSRICPKFCVQIVFEFGFKHIIGSSSHRSQLLQNLSESYRSNIENARPDTLAIPDFLCGQKVGEQWQMVPYSP